MQTSSTTHFFLQSVEADSRARRNRWNERRGTERLLARDAGLFTDGDEDRWLGWLEPEGSVEGLEALVADLDDGELRSVDTVFLLGMGGSSLGSEVVARTLGDQTVRRLVVLDTTNPEAVGSALDTADPEASLVIAASKSGSTLETAALLELFWARFERSLGDACGRRFVAVTDPGSAFETRARERHFGHVFLGDPQIGGRFSVLSPFGLVPAAAIGLDPNAIVAPARSLLEELRSGADSDAVRLGLALAACHDAGRNKVTLRTSPSLRSFGTWLEQLLAESTGKGGQGLVPVDGEPPARLGDDRVLVHLGLDAEPVEGAAADSATPRIEITMPSASTLGAEFYRWQIATAVAGAEMGLHPFDQPDVESAKVATRRFVEEGAPLDAVEVAADPVVLCSSSDGDDLDGALESLLSPSDEPGLYLAFLAYLPMAPATRDVLQELRAGLLEARGWATCVGFGPRYLHSTGQVHKGGPAQGRFLVITQASSDRREVPGTGRTLAQIHRAQALGDAQVLAERGRPTVHVELQGDLESSLSALREAVLAASSPRRAAAE